MNIHVVRKQVFIEKLMKIMYVMNAVIYITLNVGHRS